jgi:transposase
VDTFNHYIALDWAQSNMAIARMTAKAEKIAVFETPSSVKELKVYLSQLSGTKSFTLEESTASQWLYTELKEYVDEIIVCDPVRNRLLSEGAKTDKIDACKLVRLLRGGLLKPVFHSGDAVIYLRKLTSGYDDLIQTGVRLKNQRSALFRATGQDHHNEELETENNSPEAFVLKGIERRIEAYEEEKKIYAKEFARIAKETPTIRLLKSLPGIKDILAVQIIAHVVDPRRFPSSGHFLSYCGLIKLDRISGGKSYGKIAPRFSRIMKKVFKTAAISAVGQEGKNNPLRDYYLYLIKEKSYPEYQARHAVARRIAILALGILKSKKKFDPKWRERCSEVA